MTPSGTLCNFAYIYLMLFFYFWRPYTTLCIPQHQISICPLNSEHMSSLSSVTDPNFPSPSLGLPSATPSPSLGLPSAAAPPSSSAPTTVSRVESSVPRSLPPHLGFSQSKDIPSAPGGPLTVSINLFFSGLKQNKDLGNYLNVICLKTE